MGKRGPRPQPTALKALRGTIRTPDRRHGPDAMAPAGPLVAPKYFTAPMCRRWRQILEDAPANVLRRIDASSLADFVVNEAIAEQAYAACRDALVVEGDKAQVRNPYLLIYFKAVETKRALADRLGFNPSARVGPPIDDVADLDGTGDDKTTVLLEDGTRIDTWAFLAGHTSKRSAESVAYEKREARRRKKAEAAAALLKAPPLTKTPQ